MADPSKVEYWPFADVLVAPLGSSFPADIEADFSADWKRVGCLDGDAGFPYSRTWSTTKRSAWGGILMRVIRKDFDLSAKFTAFEGANETVDDLVWPSKAAASGGVSGDLLKVPTPQRVLVAFECREGTTKKRMISYHEVEVEMTGEAKDSEADVTAYEFTVQFFPDGDGNLILRQGGPDEPTLASVAITGTAAVDAGEITKLTATATWSDSSTRDVSMDAVWTSSDEAKATVEGGYVTGVAAGTSTVAVLYGNETDDVTVTVSP